MNKRTSEWMRACCTHPYILIFQIGLCQHIPTFHNRVVKYSSNIAYARVSKTNNAGHWLRWWKQILFNNYSQSGKELNSILMCAKMTGNFKRNMRRGFPEGSADKESTCKAGDFQSLGQEDPLEEETATPSSILAWKIPWTEEPGGIRSH